MFRVALLHILNALSRPMYAGECLSSGEASVVQVEKMLINDKKKA